MESPQGIHKISQWLELLQQSAVLQEAKVAEKMRYAYLHISAMLRYHEYRQREKWKKKQPRAEPTKLHEVAFVEYGF